jgi:ferredoxin
MKEKDFVQEVKFLSLDRLKCLRGDYYHNKCTMCIEVCPIDAISMVREKLTIDTSCTNCGICIGSCPSEAISMESFDDNQYAIEFEYKDKDTISCKSDSICIAVFDEHHLISMALRNEKTIKCDLSHCNGCEHNPENKTYNNIEYVINNSNKFLAEISDKQIEKIEEKSGVEASRRGLFAKVFKTTQTLKEDKNLKSTISENIIHSKVPAKRQILKNTLKKDDNLSSKQINGEYNFLVNKVIDYSSCTMCRECVEFCPTEALLSNQEQNTILYQSGKCINCNICNDICKENSVSTSYVGVDLVEFAFDRAKPLISFSLEICQDCKCAFPYKEGPKVCDRCAKFKTQEFQDIFAVASDME